MKIKSTDAYVDVKIKKEESNIKSFSYLYMKIYQEH